MGAVMDVELHAPRLPVPGQAARCTIAPHLPTGLGSRVEERQA